MGNRKGQSGLFIVLNLTLLFGVVGLAADVGSGYLARQQAQTAADATASAAALYAAQNGFTCGTGGVVCGAATACANPNVSPPTNNLQAGCLYAAANGYLNGGHGGKQVVTMTANTTTPPGVSHNYPAYWVQANISDQTSTLFGAFNKIGAFTINAVSTAGITVSMPGACIYVLASGNVANAFQAAGSTSVTATCGIYVNSTNSSAFALSGSAQAHATQILVAGGQSIVGTAIATPTPTTGSATFADPLASLSMPTFSGCDYTSYSLGGSSSATLNPGVYCGGITITQSAHVTFNPGLYVLNGGGLNAGNSATLTGTHVTFFNTGQAGYTISPITFGQSVVATLSAPTSGTLMGMLFIQDRNLTYAAANAFTSSSSSVMTGTLYFPTTSLSYAGSSTGSYMAIVANTVSFSGSSSLKNDPTGTYTGLGGHAVSLIQ